MRRRVIIASHSMLSKGMAETLKFFEGEDAELSLSRPMLTISRLKE